MGFFGCALFSKEEKKRWGRERERERRWRWRGTTVVDGGAGGQKDSYILSARGGGREEEQEEEGLPVFSLSLPAPFPQLQILRPQKVKGLQKSKRAHRVSASHAKQIIIPPSPHHHSSSLSFLLF